METQFTIRLADITIGVKCIYESTKQYCREYLSSEEPDFRITVDRADIEMESRFDSSGKAWSDACLETLALYRKIAEEMPRRNVFLFHGSAVSVDGTAYLFMGQSGAGKSTHANLWCKYLTQPTVTEPTVAEPTVTDHTVTEHTVAEHTELSRQVEIIDYEKPLEMPHQVEIINDDKPSEMPHRVEIINDDKPLIRVTGDHITVFGTPWDGKHRRSVNASAELKAAAAIVQAEHNQVVPLPDEKIWTYLIRQTYRPQHRDSLQKTLEMLQELRGRLHFFEIHCDMSPAAAQVAYESITKSM